MRDYPATIWCCDGDVIKTTIRSDSLCAAMHTVKLLYGYKGIYKSEVLPAPLN